MKQMGGTRPIFESPHFFYRVSNDRIIDCPGADGGDD